MMVNVVFLYSCDRFVCTLLEFLQKGAIVPEV